MYMKNSKFDSEFDEIYNRTEKLISEELISIEKEISIYEAQIESLSSPVTSPVPSTLSDVYISDLEDPTATPVLGINFDEKFYKECGQYPWVTSYENYDDSDDGLDLFLNLNVEAVQVLNNTSEMDFIDFLKETPSYTPISRGSFGNFVNDTQYDNKHVVTCPILQSVIEPINSIVAIPKIVTPNSNIKEVPLTRPFVPMPKINFNKIKGVHKIREYKYVEDIVDPVDPFSTIEEGTFMGPLPNSTPIFSSLDNGKFIGPKIKPTRTLVPTFKQKLPNLLWEEKVSIFPFIENIDERSLVTYDSSIYNEEDKRNDEAKPIDLLHKDAIYNTVKAKRTNYYTLFGYTIPFFQKEAIKELNVSLELAAQVYNIKNFNLTTDKTTSYDRVLNSVKSNTKVNDEKYAPLFGINPKLDTISYTVLLSDYFRHKNKMLDFHPTLNVD
jgi:hypothetical protein